MVEKTKKYLNTLWKKLLITGGMIALILTSLIVGIPILFPNTPSTGSTETRYLTSALVDTAYNLSLTQTATKVEVNLGHTHDDVDCTVYLGIKVYVLTSAYVSTLISGSTPVAIISDTASATTNWAQTGTWVHDANATAGKAIKIEVYGDQDITPPTTLRYTYKTENMTEFKGVSANTWTVYYTGRATHVGLVTTQYFCFGITANYNARIGNLGLMYVDAIAPTINDFDINTTTAGANCLFQFNISDNIALDKYIFGTNNSGSSTNDTDFYILGKPAGPYLVNITKTLIATNAIVQFNFWVWDANGTASSLGYRNFTVYARPLTVNTTWNMENRALVVGGIEGSALGNVSSTTQSNVNTTCAASATCYVGVKIYNTSTAELTSGVSAITSVTGGSGLINGTWTSPATNLEKTGVFQVKVYAGAANPPTVLVATFVTRILSATKLNATIWTFNYRLTNVTNWCHFSYGGSAGSRVLNVTLQPWYTPYLKLSDLIQAGYNYMNWAYDATTTFFGMNFENTTEADLATKITAFNNSADYINVLAWSAFAYKYEMENESEIKCALNHITMIYGLPITRGTDSYSPEDKWAVFGYYFANKYGYLTDKWNATAGYLRLKSVTESAGHPVLLIYADNTTYSVHRYYDEYVCTVNTFTLFYTICGVTNAFVDAQYWWNQINVRHWSTIEPHYKYRVDNEGVGFETSAGFFLLCVSYLKYYNSTLGNWSRVIDDFYSRFLQYSWESPQWSSNYENASTYYDVHYYQPTYDESGFGNPERRTNDNLGSWAAILGAYALFSEGNQTRIRDMIAGNTTLEPAWILIHSPYPKTFNQTSGGWLSSNAFGVNQTYNATALALVTLYFLGIVPNGNCSTAFPIEELGYLYTYEIDKKLFTMNLTTHTITFTANQNGTVQFQYGAVPCTAEFTSPYGAVYQITFTPSWNNITSIVQLETLPTNRVYFANIYQGGTPLYTGWNNFTVSASDVSKTLGQVNASLNTDGIAWSAVLAATDVGSGSEATILSTSGLASTVYGVIVPTEIRDYFGDKEMGIITMTVRLGLVKASLLGIGLLAIGSIFTETAFFIRFFYEGRPLLIVFLLPILVAVLYVLAEFRELCLLSKEYACSGGQSSFSDRILNLSANTQVG